MLCETGLGDARFRRREGTSKKKNELPGHTVCVTKAHYHANASYIHITISLDLKSNLRSARICPTRGHVTLGDRPPCRPQRPERSSQHAHGTSCPRGGPSGSCGASNRVRGRCRRVRSTRDRHTAQPSISSRGARLRGRRRCSQRRSTCQGRAEACSIGGWMQKATGGEQCACSGGRVT